MCQEEITKDKLTSKHLTEVWFVHDYVRLVFGSYWLDFNVMPTIVIRDASLSRSDVSYCNCLCGLIGTAVADIHISKDYFEIKFDGGISLKLSLADSQYIGPELIVFGDEAGVTWVL